MRKVDAFDLIIWGGPHAFCDGNGPRLNASFKTDDPSEGLRELEWYNRRGYVGLLRPRQMRVRTGQ